MTAVVVLSGEECGTGGGVWASFPFVFSLGYIRAAFHSLSTVFFATGTMYSFILVAFHHAGEQPSVLYGSYEVIGNCVGAGNHRLFVTFLVFAVISTFYAFLMSIYVGWHVWPPLVYDPGYSLEELSKSSVGRFSAEILHALANTAFLLSARGIVLIYLCIASASVEVGIGLLLWQQLQFIYEGKTYLDHLSSGDGEVGESGWHNISVFFGCPYPISALRLSSSHTGKSHKK
ncbi:S-acyltransferase 11 protein [Nymphaea thermarum]|nr:S-acyltransferase 11 protein [Nymphaea thermarum]